MVEQWYLHLAMPHILSGAVHHNHITEYHVHCRMRSKKIHHLRQAPRQVLLVAIQVCYDFTSRPAQAAVNRVIHSSIFFNKCFDSPILQQPVKRSVIGLGILNDVFNFDLLVSHRRDT